MVLLVEAVQRRSGEDMCGRFVCQVQHDSRDDRADETEAIAAAAAVVVVMMDGLVDRSSSPHAASNYPAGLRMRRTAPMTAL